MKVVIFNTLYYPNAVGGAEKSVQTLAEGLVKKDIEVTVVSTTDKSTYKNWHNGVKVIYLCYKNIY